MNAPFRTVALAGRYQTEGVAASIARIGEYLRQREWGRDEPWTELARRLFDVIHGLYLIPFREQIQLRRYLTAEGSLPPQEVFNTWLREDADALETLPGRIATLEAEIEKLTKTIEDPALYAKDRASFDKASAALAMGSNACIL